MGRSRKAMARLLLSLLVLMWSVEVLGRPREKKGSKGEASSEQCSTDVRNLVEADPSKPRATEVWIEREGKCRLQRIYGVAYATSIEKEGFCITAASAAEHG